MSHQHLHHLHLHIHLHHNLFQNNLSHDISVAVPKLPLYFLIVLWSRPVLTHSLLIILIIILMSHKLFLMSYRLVHDIIYVIIVLFILQTSMAFPVWMLMSYRLVQDIIYVIVVLFILHTSMAFPMWMMLLVLYLFIPLHVDVICFLGMLMICWLQEMIWSTYPMWNNLVSSFRCLIWVLLVIS
jgi:hypothetical protein